MSTLGLLKIIFSTYVCLCLGISIHREIKLPTRSILRKLGTSSSLFGSSLPTHIQRLTHLYSSSVPSDFRNNPKPSSGYPMLDTRKTLDLIKSTTSISDVVQRYTQVIPSGPGQFKCKCPFHDDSTPSMGISNDKGVYNCLGCGAKGDVVNFVKEVEGLSFIEAVHKTLAMTGLDSDLDSLMMAGRTDAEIRFMNERKRLEEIMRKAANFYCRRIVEDSKAGSARRHLMSRKIKPETAFKFEIGYAPSGYVMSESLVANFTAEGYTVDELVKAGLAVDTGAYKQPQQQEDTSKRNDINVSRSKWNITNASNRLVYDRFRDRLVVPIKSPQGVVIGFGGRYLIDNIDDDEDGEAEFSKFKRNTKNIPKYLNSPETMLFKKGDTLFGFDVARKAIAKEGVAIVCEGYFDVISLHDVDVEFAVGVLGTAITREHLATIAKVRKDAVIVLMMDDDAAGQAAVERFCSQVLSGLGRTESWSLDIDVRIASFRDAVNQMHHHEDEDDEESDDEITDEEDSMSISSVNIKDASDLCQYSGSRLAASTAVRKMITLAVGWRQWMAERIILRGAKPLCSGATNSPSPTPITVAAAAYALRSNTAAMSRVVRSLATFLASTPSASDRTVVANYCAETLAGPDRDYLRSQLEQDLNEMIANQAYNNWGDPTVNQRQDGTTSPPSLPSSPPKSSTMNSFSTPTPINKPQVYTKPSSVVPATSPQSNSVTKHTRAEVKQDKPSSKQMFSATPPSASNRIDYRSNIDQQPQQRTPRDAILQSQPSQNYRLNQDSNELQKTTNSFQSAKTDAILPLASASKFPSPAPIPVPAPASTLARNQTKHESTHFDLLIDRSLAEGPLAPLSHETRKYRKPISVHWEQAQLRENAFTFDSSNVRLKDSEVMLLMIFVHSPTHRQSIREFSSRPSMIASKDNSHYPTSERHESLEYSWIEPAHARFWNFCNTIIESSNITKLEIEDENGSIAQKIVNALPNIADLPSCLQTVIGGEALRGKSKLAIEFSMRDAFRTILSSATRQKQVFLIKNRMSVNYSNRSNGTNDNNYDEIESKGNEDSPVIFEAFENQLSDKALKLASELAVKSISDEYITEMRREKIDSLWKGMETKGIDTEGEEESDKKFDDIELLYWQSGDTEMMNEDEFNDELDFFTPNEVDLAAHHGGDSPVNPNPITSDAALVSETNKYEFQWDESDDAVMAVGEVSEEEKRLQAMYSKGYSSNKVGSGATFGLDDIYDDNYGKEIKPKVPSMYFNKGRGNSRDSRGSGWSGETRSGGMRKRQEDGDNSGEMNRKETKSDTWMSIHQRGGRASTFLAQKKERELRENETFEEEKGRLYDSLDPQ